MTVYDQVKKASQDFLVPELQALKAEMKRLDEKIDARFDALRNELLAEIKRLDATITAETRRVDERIASLEREVQVALEIRERLAALEAKVGLTRP